MDEPVWRQLVEAIHGSPYRLVLAVTGGGSRVVSELLESPGASQTVLEAVIPYAATALHQWLGGTPDQSCSESTARAMAMAAWMRARQLAPDAEQLIGLGATASLASNRPKQGEHRVHVAVQTATSTTSYSLVLAKNQRDRQAEERIVTQLLLLTLAKHCQLDTTAAEDALLQALEPNEAIVFFEQEAQPAWTELLVGHRQYVTYPEGLQPQIIFPGAFNPPHVGHHRIAAVAAKRLGQPVTYELSITNVDKPPLDFLEIAKRLEQLQDENAPTVLTAAPTFRAKAALFPSCTFVVGADTLARIADPSYYTGDPNGYQTALQQIADQGCRFLVFGREIDGRFRTLSDLRARLPDTLNSLSDEVTGQDFREDISSSALREDK